MLSKLHLGGLLPLLVGDGGAVEFNKVWDQLYAVLTVHLVLANRVVPEPKHFQVRQGNQVFQLPQITDQILAEVQFLQFFVVLEYFQRGDIVER